MIKIITLIPASVAYLIVVGCSGDSKGGAVDVNPDTSISGAPEAGGEDPMKQLQDEGKLPSIETGPKMTPPSGTDSDALSLYPTTVDPDQDNVPNSEITGHPEIAVDNCPNAFNPGQEDSDGDGVGNACDN